MTKRRTIVLALLAPLAALTVTLAAAPRAQADAAAEAFIQDRARRVLAILNDENANRTERQSQLREMIGATIDVELIARAAIKRYLNAARNPHYSDQAAADADFQAFLPVYEEYLLLTYESYLSVYRVADFEVVGSSDLDASRQSRYDTFSIVQTRVMGGEDNEVTDVSWDVIGRNGGLRIFDVEARGLSLLAEQETVMAEELASARGDLGALRAAFETKIESLRTKALDD